MVDDRQNNPEATGDDAGAEDLDSGSAAATDGHARPWSNLWQVPTILLSLVLIATGVWVAKDRAPKDDFEAALSEVERMLAGGRMEDAAPRLRDVLEPHLHIAKPQQRGRFHQAVADWLYRAQREEGVDRDANNVRINDQYVRAVDYGVRPDAMRLEWWANTLILLGRIDEARKRMDELEMLATGPDASPEAAERRTRVFRRLVEHELARPDAEHKTIFAMLREYRDDPRTSVDEKVWAIARKAELRLIAGQAQAAVDQLLIDLRRIEYAAADGRSVNVAELYAMLGRAYHDLGNERAARFNLELALEQFEEDVPARGRAMVHLARLDAADGEFDRAFARYDEVVRNYPGTGAFRAAILGRAETRSILGEHDEALHDYRQLVDLTRERGVMGRITPERITRSLLDRHDAAVAMGRLELALDYARVAERLFPQGSVPTDVLIRLAATSRQIAEDLIPPTDDPAHLLAIDSAARHEANHRYEQAGDYFMRHARALMSEPGQDDAWAESLWLAADSYDLAGLHARAIEHFEEYRAGRPRDDARRADVNFRLARAHHALRQLNEAVQFYRIAIEEHPRSVPATRSIVPLAHALTELDRADEAEHLLREMLQGHRQIQPDARDYRDALVTLARVKYRQGRYARAIERFTEALDRYPDDPERVGLMFDLADSHRRLALQLAERIRPPSAESPGERRRLNERRRQSLAEAETLFDRVTAGYEAIAADASESNDGLSRAQRDRLRYAYLYRADCAFQLGDYERAIQLYDQAARRYTDHHASMHALVQIVNCYMALEQHDRAAAAHRRALVRLRQLRDDAFDAPDALMDRGAWERWLENLPVNPTRTAQAAGGEP